MAERLFLPGRPAADSAANDGGTRQCRPVTRHSPPGQGPGSPRGDRAWRASRTRAAAGRPAADGGRAVLGRPPGDRGFTLHELRMIAPARLAAYECLLALSAGRGDLGTTLEPARLRLDDPRDRALLTEIAVGVQRWRALLDHLIVS